MLTGMAFTAITVFLFGLSQSLEVATCLDLGCRGARWCAACLGGYSCARVDAADFVYYFPTDPYLHYPPQFVLCASPSLCLLIRRSILCRALTRAQKTTPCVRHLNVQEQWALATRFIGGLFNGVIGVTKTYIGLITDESNEAQVSSLATPAPAVAHTIPPLSVHPLPPP